MDVLWESAEPLTVRQVGARLTDRDLAHTTVMTVLDRLAKKGFARRQRDGRAWRYRAAAACWPFSPVRDIRAAISPVTIGVEKDVPLHFAMP